MDKILRFYAPKRYFSFQIKEDLRKVCNASDKEGGIYLVYDTTGEKRDLIYIGSSGHIKNDGSFFVRKGGLRERIVNGHQFGKGSGGKRYISWPKQMRDDKIDCLEIECYITHDKTFIHSPCYVEHLLLHEYYSIHKKLPKWNKKF